MVNVTASPKPRDGVDFFPLSVDYEEKLYAVGKIPAASSKEKADRAKRLSSLRVLLTVLCVPFSERYEKRRSYRHDRSVG